MSNSGYITTAHHGKMIAKVIEMCETHHQKQTEVLNRIKELARQWDNHAYLESDSDYQNNVNEGMAYCGSELIALLEPFDSIG